MIQQRNAIKILYVGLFLILALASVFLLNLILAGGLIRYLAVLPFILVMIFAPALALTLSDLYPKYIAVAIFALSFAGMFAVCRDIGITILMFFFLFSVALIFTFVPKNLRNLRTSLSFIMPGGIILFGLGVCAFGYFKVGSFSPLVLFNYFIDKARLALLKLQDFYNSQTEVLGQKLTQYMNDNITQMIAQLSFVTITMILFAICFIMLQCFASLRVSRYLLKKVDIKYGVWSVESVLPTRGLGYLYIILFIVALFSSLTSYYIGMYCALIIFGWIFVIAALYKLDRYLLRIRVHVAARRLVQILLSGLSLFTMSLSIFTPYGILLLIGMFVSTVTKNGGVTQNNK